MVKLASNVIHSAIVKNGQVSVPAPDLREGQQIAVILIEPEATSPDSPGLTRENLMSFLQSLTPSGRTAEEVDRYVREERDSWEQ